MHKQCLKNFWKIQIFTETGDTQSLQVWSNFDPLSPLKMAKIEKSKYFLNKNSAIELLKFANEKTVSPLPFK